MSNTKVLNCSSIKQPTTMRSVGDYNLRQTTINQQSSIKSRMMQVETVVEKSTATQRVKEIKKLNVNTLSPLHSVRFFNCKKKVVAKAKKKERTNSILFQLCSHSWFDPLEPVKWLKEVMGGTAALSSRALPRVAVTRSSRLFPNIRWPTTPRLSRRRGHIWIKRRRSRSCRIRRWACEMTKWRKTKSLIRRKLPRLSQPRSFLSPRSLDRRQQNRSRQNSPTVCHSRMNSIIIGRIIVHPSRPTQQTATIAVTSLQTINDCQTRPIKMSSGEIHQTMLSTLTSRWSLSTTSTRTMTSRRRKLSSPSHPSQRNRNSFSPIRIASASSHRQKAPPTVHQSHRTVNRWTS